MKIVSNSTPLIALSRINELDLLRTIFDTIIVPTAVYNEVVLEGAGRPGVEEIAGADGGSIEIAATDTYRLTFIQAKIAPAERFDPLFIPISSVESLLRVLGKNPVEVSWDSKSIMFKSQRSPCW
ncbi:MAG: hypothetical protein ABSA82_02860 [Thermacetogeniaceae bacterium]|jgi:hypothetical protein